MVKHKPTLTLVEMEKEMGYQVDPLSSLTDIMNRYYSDLRLIPDDIIERTKREYEEFKAHEQHQMAAVATLPALGETEASSRRVFSIVNFQAF